MSLSGTSQKLTLITLSVFQSGLRNGGPAGLIYGFLFVWVGTALQTAVMAELASMYVPKCAHFPTVLRVKGSLLLEVSIIGKVALLIKVEHKLIAL